MFSLALNVERIVYLACEVNMAQSLEFSDSEDDVYSSQQVAIIENLMRSNDEPNFDIGLEELLESSIDLAVASDFELCDHDEDSTVSFVNATSVSHVYGPILKTQDDRSDVERSVFYTNLISLICHLFFKFK